jgi:hypothetical protein
VAGAAVDARAELLHDLAAEDPEVLEAVAAQLRAVPPPLGRALRRVLRAEPWHVRLDNGSTAAAPGRAPHVDLELRCRFDDWVDVVAGRLDPVKAVATGRLRPHGTPRTLWRARGLFA